MISSTQIKTFEDEQKLQIDASEKNFKKKFSYDININYGRILVRSIWTQAILFACFHHI